MNKDTLTKKNDGFVHYLYKITNLLDNRYYIGVHSLSKKRKATPLTDNYWGSGTLIRLIIKELGKKNFKKEILFVGETREEVLKKEAEMVSLETLNDPLNYNLALGGDSFGRGRIPAYTDDKTKIIFVPKKIIIENNLSIVQENPFYVFNEETKTFSILTEVDNQCKNIKILKPVLTDQDAVRRDKTVSRLKGKVIAVRVGDTSRTAVILEKGDARLVSGEYVGFAKGQKLSEEARKKKLGKNNPSYNTMWITNGVENKRVQKSTKDQIPFGWYAGRTISTEEKQKIARTIKNNYDNLRTPVSIKNLKTGKEEIIKLDRIFFRNGELITAQALQDLYGPVNSWEKVTKILNLSRDSVIKIRDFYISLGYTFKSNAIRRRPGRRNVKSTLNKMMIHKEGIMRYVDKTLIDVYLSDGWELGMAT